MLPFLKAKQSSQVGVIVKQREPDEDKEDMGPHAIMACADELIRAVHAKDAKAVAAALKDAFDILESQPHEENSYDSQNEEAGEE